ncbi:hypothetical protein GE09DRAFT_102951 [Coniochaeta sp. 2T2.1]|nr:hypothetical protein GE09DRAFT_102951 [Coniochaeta sp. 2T2.1]
MQYHLSAFSQDWPSLRTRLAPNRNASTGCLFAVAYSSAVASLRSSARRHQHRTILPVCECAIVHRGSNRFIESPHISVLALAPSAIASFLGGLNFLPCPAGCTWRVIAMIAPLARAVFDLCGIPGDAIVSPKMKVILQAECTRNEDRRYQFQFCGAF